MSKPKPTASQDTATHLSVILDLSPSQWHLSAQSTNLYPLSLQSFLSQLLAFLNAHIASKHENTLAVFGAFPGKSTMLYSSTDASHTEGQTPDANSYPMFRTVDSSIVQRITEEVDLLTERTFEDEKPCALVGAIAKALCYINYIGIPSSDDVEVLPDPRILILSVSPDLSSSYIPIMNCIFSAQKLKVTIDVCKIYGTDTVFLQQAAHLTGGSYLYLEHRDALLQYLIMTYLPPPSMRKIFSVPKQDKIDFRAACFCHKRIVDIGFVCSVCLSIFCQPVAVCTTCRTKFPLKTLKRLNESRPLNLASKSQPSTNGTNTPRTSGAATPAITTPSEQVPAPGLASNLR